jgi:uncharacterized protein
MRKSSETRDAVRKLKVDRTKISIGYGKPSEKATQNCIFLAHGVKNSMNSSNITYLHSALAHKGFLTVRFNFPFAEGRFRLARKPDRKDVLVKCYRKVVEDTRHSEWKPKNLFLGGISLGAAVASHVIADGPEVPGAKGLFFLSYPIHLPRTPQARGDLHLDKISLPMLFVSGTRDIYAEEETLKTTVSRLGPRAELHMIDADHALNRRKGRKIYSKTLAEVAGVIAEWAGKKSQA